MSDILSRFTTKVEPPNGQAEPEDAAPVDKRAYQALRPEPQNRRTPARLRIVYGDGVVSLMSYTFLSEVLCTSPQFVSLIYSHCIITLEGRNLLALVDLLQEDKARTITCFNGRWHDEPEAGAAVITRISRQAIAASKDVAGSKQLGKTAEVSR